MAWAKNDTETLSGTTASIDFADITSYKFNVLLTHYFPTGGNGAETEIVCNSENTNEYARRYSQNGGADGTQTSMPELIITTSNVDVDSFKLVYFCNISGEEKLFIMFSADIDTAGATTAPARDESVGKYDTTTGQINDFELQNTFWTGDFAINSNASLLGTD